MDEREAKFTPGPAFRLPDLTDTHLGLRAEPGDTLRLQATYFDTDDLRLARAGASLRHRSDEGWMVKLPVSSTSLLVRRELRVPGEPGNPPPDAIDLVQAVARRAPLRAVARLNTVRERTTLHDRHGVEIAEVVDDEVSVLDGARLAARFRELEVEFREAASPVQVAAVLARLGAAGAGRPDLVPKIVRALGPAALEPPDVLPPDALDHPVTAIDAARTAVANSLARLVAHDPGVRIGDDPEAVHQARVATRRLRSDLKTFRPVLDRTVSDPLRDELRWLGGQFGAVRDADVLLARLGARIAVLAPTDQPTANTLLEGLHAARDDARKELLASMRSDRYLRLLDRLVEAARTLPAAPSDDLGGLDAAEHTAPRLVRAPWRRLKEAVTALDPDPPDADLHAVRILAKRCRYAAEAVAPVIGKPAARFGREIANLQEVLGEHQDAVIAEHWLREQATSGVDGTAAFVAGEMAAIERDAAERSRRQWERAWDGASREASSVVVSNRDVVRAAGGIVHRVDGAGTPRVLLVHRPRYDDWSFPKGKADPGERARDTARREVHEETGLSCTLGDAAGTTRYRDSRDRPKVVRYWYMEPEARGDGAHVDPASDGTDEEFTPNDEVDAVRWCTPAEAVELLSYDHDRELLRDLSHLA